MTFEPARLTLDFNWLYAFLYPQKQKPKSTSGVQLAFTFQLRFGSSIIMRLSLWSSGVSLLCGLQLFAPVSVMANDFSSFLSANASLGEINELCGECVSSVLHANPCSCRC